MNEGLCLRWMSPRFIEESLNGWLGDAEEAFGASLPPWWPDEDARYWLAVRLEEMRQTPSAAEWLLRGILRRADKRLLGTINFHDPPDERNRAELGYRVFEAYRRLGYATEAAIAMMHWPHTERGVETFVLSISPENGPSLAMAAKMGFRRVGSRIDDIDDEEWVFELNPGHVSSNT